MEIELTTTSKKSKKVKKSKSNPKIISTITERQHFQLLCSWKKDDQSCLVETLLIALVFTPGIKKKLRYFDENRVGYFFFLPLKSDNTWVIWSVSANQFEKDSENVNEILFKNVNNDGVTNNAAPCNIEVTECMKITEPLQLRVDEVCSQNEQ